MGNMDPKWHRILLIARAHYAQQEVFAPTVKWNHALLDHTVKLELKHVTLAQMGNTALQSQPRKKNVCPRIVWQDITVLLDI